MVGSTWTHVHPNSFTPYRSYMRNTDQRSSSGPVDAGSRSCGVRVGEQPVNLAQRHATSTIAHLETNSIFSCFKSSFSLVSSGAALPSLSDLQFPERPVRGWRDTPWHRRTAPWWLAWRSAFTTRGATYKTCKNCIMEEPAVQLFEFEIESYLKKFKHHVVQMRWNVDHSDGFSLLFDCQDKQAIKN